MFAGVPFAGAPFAGILLAPTRGRGGIGGSGMSDAEYERLLRRLGAPVERDDKLSGEELAALLMLDLM